MKMRKFAGVSLCLALLAGIVPGSAGAQAKKPVKIAAIVQNLGTQSYNDDVVTGLKAAEKELGTQSVIIEIASVADVANSIRTVIGQGAQLVVIPSPDYKDGMLEVSGEYPDVKFIYAESNVAPSKNILTMRYRENEASFVVGALGALLSKSGRIGAVLAIPSDVQNKYIAGYTAGARAVNPSIEVQSAWTNSYGDVAKGLEVAKIMYSKGCDFVGTYAGACNLGVFKAAAEAGAGKYAFGAATGQFDKGPDKILASVVKPIDKALVVMIKDYLDGKFDGSVPLSLGLKEAGVGVRFTPNAELRKVIPASVQATIDDIIAKVNSGAIKVPANDAELKAFTYKYRK